MTSHSSLLQRATNQLPQVFEQLNLVRLAMTKIVIAFTLFQILLAPTEFAFSAGSGFVAGAGAGVASGRSCENAFYHEAHDLLVDMYDSSKVLGIGVPDHWKMSPFEKLADLVRARGLDPKLKTIALEDSADLAQLYAYASVNDMSWDEFFARGKQLYLGINHQTEYVVKHLLPVVREINRKRPKDPILVHPIDSVSSETFKELFNPNRAPLKPHSDRVSLEGIVNQFPGSIERERGTAKNFNRMILEAFPNRKAIVIYHGAHIFKNLSAIGPDRIQGQSVAKRTYLTWMSMAMHANPEFAVGYSVVAADYVLVGTREGSYQLPNDVPEVEGARGYYWQPSGLTSAELFTEKSFFRSYRGGSIAVMSADAPVFDAIVVDR